jgi:N-acetyl-alpha-D-glucosaminyl L-malate synthase BshA
MKVLVLTTAFAGWKDDRTSSFVYELSKRLKEEGFEIVVLAPHCEGAKRFEIMDELKVYRFPYFYPRKYQRLAYGGGILYNLKNSHLAKIQAPLFFLSELLYTIKLIRKEKIDVIHSHWLVPQGLVGAICRKYFKVPHIATVHGSDVYLIEKSKIRNRICSFILHNSDKITANSSYTKNIIQSIDDGAKNKMEVVPMGVDIKNRFKSEDNTNLKEDFGVECLILSVGRLIGLKGTKYLIIAMKEVIRKFPTAKLLIVGDGPEKEKLEKLANELNLEDNVIFTGHIKNLDLPKYYSFADVFVTPSITIDGQAEGLGVVLLEAMACGTPVIGSNMGGIPDIIKDGYNGFLVPEKSPKDLADKIIELLSNKKMAEEFSVNGLKIVKERFSWEIVTERFYRLYEEILEEER